MAVVVELDPVGRICLGLVLAVHLVNLQHAKLARRRPRLICSAALRSVKLPAEVARPAKICPLVLKRYTQRALELWGIAEDSTELLRLRLAISFTDAWDGDRHNECRVGLDIPEAENAWCQFRAVEGVRAAV